MVIHLSWQKLWYIDYQKAKKRYCCQRMPLRHNLFPFAELIQTKICFTGWSCYLILEWAQTAERRENSQKRILAKSWRHSFTLKKSRIHYKILLNFFAKLTYLILYLLILWKFFDSLINAYFLFLVYFLFILFYSAKIYFFIMWASIPSEHLLFLSIFNEFLI